MAVFFFQYGIEGSLIRDHWINTETKGKVHATVNNFKLIAGVLRRCEAFLTDT